MEKLYGVEVKKPSILRRFYRKIYQPQAVEICDIIIPEIVVLGIKNNFKSNNTKNDYDLVGPKNNYGNKFYTSLFKKYIGRCMRILILCFMRKKREMLGNFQLIYMRPIKNYLRLIDRNEDEIKDDLGIQIRRSAILFKKMLSFLVQDKWFRVMDDENTDRYYLYPEFLKIGDRREIIDMIEHLLYIKEIYQILYIDRYHFCPDKSKYLKRTEAENKDSFVYKMFYEGSAYQKYYKKYMQAQAEMQQENRQEFIYIVSEKERNRKMKINSKIKINNLKQIRTIRGVIRSQDRLPNQFIGQAPMEFCHDLLNQQAEEQAEHDYMKQKGRIQEQQIEFDNSYLNDPQFKQYVWRMNQQEDNLDDLGRSVLKRNVRKAKTDQEYAAIRGNRNKTNLSISK